MSAKWSGPIEFGYVCRLPKAKGTKWNLRSKDFLQRNILANAANYGQTENVRLLLERKDVDIAAMSAERDIDGFTALHFASQYFDDLDQDMKGNLETAKLLVQKFSFNTFITLFIFIFIFWLCEIYRSTRRRCL